MLCPQYVHIQEANIKFSNRTSILGFWGLQYNG